MVPVRKGDYSVRCDFMSKFAVRDTNLFTIIDIVAEPMRILRIIHNKGTSETVTVLGPVM